MRTEENPFVVLDNSRVFTINFGIVSLTLTGKRAHLAVCFEFFLQRTYVCGQCSVLCTDYSSVGGEEKCFAVRSLGYLLLLSRTVSWFGLVHRQPRELSHVSVGCCGGKWIRSHHKTSLN